MITDEELDDWLKHIDRNRWKEVAELLEEIKEHRASKLRPAIRFVGDWIEDLLTKLDEEVKEVHAEVSDDCHYNVSSFAMELVDVQMVCETILYHIGLTEIERNAVRQKVIAKNEARGYYK